jgi:hypothetical protein
MSLVAGFVGVRADGEGVAPAIGWAVAHATPERRFRAYSRGEGRVQLSPRGPVRSLEGLAEQIAVDQHAHATVTVWWSDALVSLEGIEQASGVDELTLMACNALESLSPLANAPSLRRLDVRQCERLVDLSPLASMKLEALSIAHCPNVRDYRPVARVRGLSQLDLVGDSVPEHVRGSHVGPQAIADVQKALES